MKIFINLSGLVFSGLKRTISHFLSVSKPNYCMSYWFQLFELKYGMPQAWKTFEKWKNKTCHLRMNLQFFQASFKRTACVCDQESGWRSNREYR